VLADIGVPAVDADVLAIAEFDALWEGFLPRLREQPGELWPSAEADAVRASLSEVADAVGASPSVWITTPAEEEPVGVHVPADSLLRVALDGFVSRASDLMLATPEGASGICVELNHLPDGDFYEVTAWGVFDIPGRGSWEEPAKPIP